MWSTPGDRRDPGGLLKDLLARAETSLVVARQPCVLAAPKIRFYEKAAADRRQACPSP